MYFVIGGDLAPTEINISQFKDGSIINSLNEKAVNTLKNAEFRICNLETPLYNGHCPIKKFGPNLVADESSILGIKAIGIDLFTLANNHIMDHGNNGLESTIKCLKQAQIDYVGVGQNISEAKEPYFFEFAGKIIGVYACAEHEFSIATDDSSGANPVDLLEMPDHIQRLREKSDYVIVLYHGGKEFYRYPSPDLQKVCRKLIDKGADLVVTQHSHCVGCKENYKNGTIVYGQGNFIFERNQNEFTEEGLLISVDDKFNIDYLPLRNCSIDNFYKRSEDIKNFGFVETKYKEFAQAMFSRQTIPFRSRESKVFKALNRLSRNKLRKKRTDNIPDERLCSMINYIDCEAHRELLLTGLKGRVRG